ncbi:MAG: RIP metalloprotease RseP [Patescibacteria group bacterium]
MLVTLIVFVAILALLVLAHEAGHFVAARKNGIQVDEFGFGLPPRIFGAHVSRSGWSWIWGGRELTDAEKQSGTVYSLNLIPLGGFVKIKGENGDMADEPDSFGAKKIWQRAVVLVAGVSMNFILAAVLLGIGFIIGIPQSLDEVYRGAIIKDAKIEVMSVLSGSPAEKAGIAAGDEILKADDLDIQKVNDLQNYVSGKNGQSVKFIFQRGGEIIIKEIIPYQLKTTKRGGIGIALLESGIVSYPWYLAFIYGFFAAGIFAWEVARTLWFLLAGLFQGQGSVAESLSGPVGIAVLTGRVARLGFSHLMQFAAMLSINLAILNILPFPALDGGRVLFLIIEKLRGKPLHRKFEEWAHTAGFALLMILIIFVTYKDVIRFSSSFIRIGQKIIGG